MSVSRRTALIGGASLIVIAASLTTAVSADAAAPSFVPGPTLKRGSRGPAVRALQQTLADLTYQPFAFGRGIDDSYGTMTFNAVRSFQKVAGLAVDGVAGPKTQSALAVAGRPGVPGRGTNYIFVDLARGVLFEIDGGVVTHTTIVSNGSNQYYTYKGRRLLADTPAGTFAVVRREGPGYKSGMELGAMPWATFYNNDGFAIHDGTIPAPWGNASHGCTRQPAGLTQGLQQRSPIGRTVILR